MSQDDPHHMTLKNDEDYPLVNVHIAMENHHFIAGKIHYCDWAIFHCFLYVHQRVKPTVGRQQKTGNFYLTSGWMTPLPWLLPDAQLMAATSKLIQNTTQCSTTSSLSQKGESKINDDKKICSHHINYYHHYYYYCFVECFSMMLANLHESWSISWLRTWKKSYVWWPSGWKEIIQFETHYLVAHPTARKWVITSVISGLTLQKSHL